MAEYSETPEESLQKKKAIRENHLDFLYELYTSGVDITPDNYNLLVVNGYIALGDKVPQPKKNISYNTDKVKESRLEFKTDEQRETDLHIDILKEDSENPVPKGDIEIIRQKDLAHRKDRAQYLFEGGGKEITKEDWLPEFTMEHTKEFVDWIDSINFLGFKNRKPYRKFTLYCQQANEWLSEKSSYSDITNKYEVIDYEDKEMDRCDENTLYWANKYLSLKEGDMNTGVRQYKATPALAIMIYLFDCGYSYMLAKPRQMAATSTLGACAIKKTVFKKNHFIKFITQDKLKGEEIFEDKMKYPFGELPLFMKDEVDNDRDNLFKLGKSAKKGDQDGTNSRIKVDAPTKTAISGGSPNLAMVDEAGNIPILTEIIEDAKPTMYWMNPKTNRLEMKRQFISWGTGGEMEKGGKAFETEFMSRIKAWQERDFSGGIIPIFFDWTVRPGITQEFYDKEKKEYYSKGGPNANKSKIMFHQQYPSCIADVFKTTGKTLVDDEYIDTQLIRIRAYAKDKHGGLYKRGYFEPIYDYTKEEDERSDTPYRIIGSNFVPTEDIDPRASCTIFIDPKPGWINRYYQGTDPIATDTGVSNMSSAIFDNHYKTPVAIMDFRSKDYRYTFLQCLLLGLHYDTGAKKMGVKELVEANIGQSYTQYKSAKGFENSMVLNFELPFYLQNKTTLNEGIGIDNRGLRSITIINKLHEYIQAFGEKIYFDDFFMQLKTFVCTVTDKGRETWGPSNRKYFKDDILFANAFSYICALCYGELVPTNIEQQSQKTRIEYQLSYDEQYNLRRVPVKVRG